MARFVLLWTLVLLGFWPHTALAEKRVALVIGNGAYQNVPTLPNPTRDAEAIADLLRTRAGFELVQVHNDLKSQDFMLALRAFKKVAEDADIALVFYAGHAIQLRETNYMVAVDATLDDEDDAQYWNQAIPLDLILGAARAKRLGVVILDACRDNPFIRKMRTRGVAPTKAGLALAPIKDEGAHGDTLIVYATAAGLVAADGEGEHSPFTEALLKHLAEPGLDIRRMFGKVRDEVRQKTGREQIPYYYGTLGGDEIALVPAPAETDAPGLAGQEEDLLVQRVLRQFREERDAAKGKAAEQLKAAEEKRRADEQRVRQEAEAKRKADAEQAAEAKRKADKQRVQQEAEAKRKADAEQAAAAKRKADEQRAQLEAEAKRKADAEQAAEAKRKADEQRAQQEAEAKRKAEAEAAEAKRKADTEQAAAAKRKTEAEQAAAATRNADDPRVQQEAEAKRKAEAAAAEAKQKAEQEQAPNAASAPASSPSVDSAAADPNRGSVAEATPPARVETETVTTPATPAPSPPAGDADKETRLAAIDPTQSPTELKPPPHLLLDGQRIEYLKQVQTALKGSDCYEGTINGDVDDARAALERFATSYKGVARQVDLTSATIDDYVGWLSWFKGLEKFSCPSEDPSGRANKTTRKKKPREEVETTKERRGSKKEASPRSKPNREARRQPRSAPSRGSGGGGASMGGTGF